MAAIRCSCGKELTDKDPCPWPSGMICARNLYDRGLGFLMSDCKHGFPTFLCRLGCRTGKPVKYDCMFGDCLDQHACARAGRCDPNAPEPVSPTDEGLEDLL